MRNLRFAICDLRLKKTREMPILIQSKIANCKSQIMSLAAFMTTAILLLSGCELPGAIWYKTMGPPAVEAKYVPVKVPMLVLVENYRSSSSQLESEQLGRFIVDQIKTHDIAPAIEPAALYELRDARGKDFARMTIPAVGQAAGAKQVLYVDLVQSQVESQGGDILLQGRLGVRVRVVDVAGGQTLWPVDMAGGYPIEIETPFVQSDDNVNEMTIRRQLYEIMADRIAKLFYKWKPEDLQGGEE